MKQGSVMVLVLFLLLASPSQPALAGEDPPPTPVEIGTPVQSVTTRWVMVDDVRLPVTVVHVSQTASTKPSRQGGIVPNLSDTRTSGSYSMTMVRWLRNSPDWLGRPWVDGGGETKTNVTAAQLHLKGRQMYGNPGNCTSGVNWYQPADAYNTKSLKGQVPYKVMFASGLQHCIRNGEHGAKFPGLTYWTFWYTGQTGPFVTW